MNLLTNIELEPDTKILYTPGVFFNAETGVCKISGESYPEDAAQFYAPLKEWLIQYTTVLKKPIVFNIELSYMDSSSSKSILGLLLTLKEYENNQGDVTVNWYYRETDVDMIEDAEDISLESKLPINFIALNP
jgi:hypothetical protein